MDTYLIEFRFQGYAKKYIKNKIFEIGKKFKIKGAIKKRIVPHITLFGPFHSNNESKVISVFQKIVRKYKFVKFNLRGFGKFDKRVIYVDIIPSENMKSLRRELSKELLNLKTSFIFKTVKSKSLHDNNENFFFHATIALNDIHHKFDKIWRYLHSQIIPNLEQRLIRITLLKNGKILKEYDFLQEKLLNRSMALNRDIWRKTVSLMRNNSLVSNI